MPQSCGVLGGKPNLAYYFIGYIGEFSQSQCAQIEFWVIKWYTHHFWIFSSPQWFVWKLIKQVMLCPWNVSLRHYRFCFFRWRVDLSGPSHYTAGRGHWIRQCCGRSELSLSEDPSPHENHQPGPFCCTGESSNHGNVILCFPSAYILYSLSKD